MYHFLKEIWVTYGHVAKQQPWIISNKLNLCGESQKWTIAFVSVLHMPKESLFIYAFLYLGHDTSEPLHMSFVIGTRHKRTISYKFLYLGYTPQVNHFSLLGTRHKWTTSYEFRYWDTPQANHFIYAFLYLGYTPQVNHFFTWDTPQVNHFIWVSLLGTRYKRTTLYLINFFAWDTPHVNNFIWVSVLGTRRKWTTSYEFLYLGYATSEPLQMNLFMWAPHSKRAHVSPTACFDKKQNLRGGNTRPRGGNTRLRGGISRASFQRSVMSSFTISERALAKRLSWECATGLAYLILFGVGETHLSCPKGFASPTVA